MQLRKLLNTPEGYKVTKTEFSDDQIDVWIEPYKRKLAICSNCGQVHKEGFHGTEEVTARDMPSVGRKIILHVKKRRYRCPKDGGIHVEEIDWLKKKQDIPLDLLKKFTV